MTAATKTHATQAQIDELHDRLFDLMETVTQKLYRHTLDRLRTINPTLEDIAGLAGAMIEILQNSGNEKIRQMREACSVLREAAEAVRCGDEKTVSDCAYHITETIRLYRAG